MSFRRVGPRLYECEGCGAQGGPRFEDVTHELREGVACPMAGVLDGPLFDDAAARGVAEAIRRNRDLHERAAAASRAVAS